MGNRVKAGNSGDSAMDETYTVNALNQITGKENNAVHVSGLAGQEGVAVKSTAPLTGDAATQGRFWSVEVATANTDGPAKEKVPLWFGKAGAGPGGTDLLAGEERTIFQPKALEKMGYDNDGNLTGDGVWSYTYDEHNRLVAMQTRAVAGDNVIAQMLGVDGAPQPKRVEFKYDYMGRRVSKKTFAFDHASNPLAPDWIAEKETRFIWNDWTLIAEVDAGGTTQIARHFYWTDGGAGGLLMIQDNDAEEGGTYFPGYDGNGNVSVLLKAGTVAGAMTVAAKYEYSPFGELLRREGPYARRNPFIWSTEYADHETGLVYYGYRYYSPRLGRFINKDPIDEVGGINLYAFVGNNPVNYNDVLGLCRTGGACTEDDGCKNGGSGTCPCGPNCGNIKIVDHGVGPVVDNGDGTYTNYNADGAVMIYGLNPDGTAYLVKIILPDGGVTSYPNPYEGVAPRNTTYVDEMVFIEPTLPADIITLSDGYSLLGLDLVGLGGHRVPSNQTAGIGINGYEIADITNSTAGLVGSLSASPAQELQAAGKFAMNGKIYKAGFLGNQYVSSSSVAAAKSSQAALSTAGRVVTAGGAGLAVYDVYNGGASNMSLARGAIGVIRTASAFIPVVGPFVALGISITNAAGGFNWLYNQFDNTPRFGNRPGQLGGED
jgi:RHS repeat-associated protein